MHSANFDPYASSGSVWPSYIYESKPSVRLEECSLMCSLDGVNDCGYFVHESGICYLGNLETTSPISINVNVTTTVYAIEGNLIYWSNRTSLIKQVINFTHGVRRSVRPYLCPSVRPQNNDYQVATLRMEPGVSLNSLDLYIIFWHKML